MNTLENKIISFREIFAKRFLDMFCVDETKWDDSLLNARILLENLQLLHFYKWQNLKGD